MVELVKGKERAVIEVFNDPAFGNIDAFFHTGFILRRVGLGSHSLEPEMSAEGGVLLVQIPHPCGLGDLVCGCGRVIRNHDPGDTAEVVKGLLVGVEPVTHALVKPATGMNHAGKRQGCHKDLDFVFLTQQRVHHGHGFPCPVDLHDIAWKVLDRGGEIVFIDVIFKQ